MSVNEYLYLCVIPFPLFSYTCSVLFVTFRFVPRPASPDDVAPISVGSGILPP